MLPPDALPANLLLCLRHDADLTLLSQFTAETWAKILLQARRSSVDPFLYRRFLRAKGSLSIPPAIYEEMREAYYRTLAENTIAFDVLARLLAAFQTARLPVILLKGAYLAEQVYADIGVRPMVDLDLLVSEADLRRGLEVLKGMGFQPERDFWPEVDGAHHFHAPPQLLNGVMIELHWNLQEPDGPVQVDPAGLWAHARKVAGQNGEALTLSAVDHLLYLCVHTAYNHRFYHQLGSLLDITEMLRVEQAAFDWEDLMLTAIQWNAGRGVYLALRLAQELLGAEIPVQVLAQLEPPGFNPQAVGWARSNLFLESNQKSPAFNRLLTSQNMGQRLAAIRNALFPSPAEMAMKYAVPPASWRIWALYPWHAINRITKHAGHVVRGLLHRDPQEAAEAESDVALIDWLGIKE